MDDLIEFLAERSHEGCSIDECSKPVLARGWCRLHYLRWWRTGSTETPLVSMALSERLWATVDKSGECWPRAGGNGLDYTRLNRGTGNRERVLAHDLAWELASGAPVPEGLQVLHICDNPPCVRNDDHGEYLVNGIAYERRGHLFLGTNAVNVADKMAKGRQSRGLTSGKAKTTPDAVREMRGAYQFGGASYSVLAERFGIRRNTVKGIVARRRWTWVA